MKETYREQINTSPIKIDADMQIFKDAIKEFKMADLDIQDTFFLDNVNPDDLTEKDMKMWKMIDDAIISEKLIKNTLLEFNKYYLNIKTDNSKNFAGYLKNKIDLLKKLDYIADQKINIFD